MWPFKKRTVDAIVAMTSPPAALRHDRQDGPGERHDGWQSALTGIGSAAYDKRLASMFVSDPVDPTEAVELWRGNDLAGKIVEALPDAMVREGWEIRVDGDVPNAKEIEKKITAYWEDLDLVGHLWMALCYERAYGGGAILLGCNDLREMQEPLDIDHVATFDWIHALEPLELRAIQWQTDPNLKDFGWPTIYMLNPVTVGGSKIMGVHVHASRLIIFPGIRVSRRQVTMQAGWGDATLTRCRAVLRDYNTAWDAAAILVHDFAQAVYKIKGLSEIIAMDKDKELVNRIRAMELSRSIVRATIIDGDVEDFTRQQTPLTGLPDMLDKFATRLAAAADMPATLMMGMSPAGLNATGDSDIRSWYDRVAAAQTRKLRPAIERVCRVIMSVLDIEEPESWHIEFNPLWQPTEKEQADARLVQAQADHIYIDDSVFSPDEIRTSRAGGAQYSLATQIDSTTAPGVGTHGEPLMPSTGQTVGSGAPPPTPPQGTPPVGEDQTPVGPDAQAYRPTPGQSRKVTPNITISFTNDDERLVDVSRDDAWSEEARAAALEARKAGAHGEKEKPLTREQRATQLAQKASERAHQRNTVQAHVAAQGQHLRAAAAHRAAGNAVEASAHAAHAGAHAKEAKTFQASRKSEKTTHSSEHAHGEGGHGESKHGEEHGEGKPHGEGKHGGHGKEHGGHEHGGHEGGEKAHLAGEGLEKILEVAEKSYGAVAGEKHDASDFYEDTVEARGNKWVVLSKEGATLAEYDTEEDANERLRQIEYFKNKKKTA